MAMRIASGADNLKYGPVNVSQENKVASDDSKTTHIKKIISQSSL